jgi:hypothetical protein
MEIKFVENKSPFFQLQNLPTYKLTCEAFEYAGEDIATGVAELDQFQLLKSNATGLTLSVYSGQFSVGETITCTVSGKTITAEVVSHVDTLLTVVNIQTNDSQTHKIVGSIVGSLSGATATVADSEDIETMEAMDPSVQNFSMETEGNAIIDFTEINPFGEANYQT